MEALPEELGKLSSLRRKLSINQCRNLVSFPKELKGLHSLIELNIYECPKLRSLEFLGCLTRLKILCISGLEELEEFPDVRPLSDCLEKLVLMEWDKLNQLPHQIQHLKALKELEIKGLNGIEAVPEWLGNLSSLQTLGILRCSNLKQLPEAIRGLSKLTSLSIDVCSKLKERCTGSDWPKISHIPNICVDWTVLQSEGFVI